MFFHRCFLQAIDWTFIAHQLDWSLEDEKIFLFSSYLVQLAKSDGIAFSGKCRSSNVFRSTLFSCDFLISIVNNLFIWSQSGSYRNEDLHLRMVISDFEFIHIILEHKIWCDQNLLLIHSPNLCPISCANYLAAN